MPRTLRGRLFWAFLGPSIVFIGALNALAFFAARGALQAEVGARLADSAAATASSLPTGLVARFRPGSTRTHGNLLTRLQRVVASLEARRIFLITLDGRSLVDTSADAPEPGLPDRDVVEDRFELERVAAGETASSVLYEGLDGLLYMRGYAPVVHEGEVVAAVGVEGSAGNYARIGSLRNYMMGLGLLALCALASVVVAFSRAVTAPLKRLAEAASRIGAGFLEHPVEARGAQEIRVLGRTMDEMRHALLRREREMQMMLGGIAHEVRNPLGGMELFLGLLRDDLSEQAEELELLQRVDRELGNLKRIVEEFLAFARNMPVEMAPVALAPLIDEVDGLVEICVERDGDLAEPGGGGYRVLAERGQLRRLVLNLVRNARQAGAQCVRIGATKAQGDGYGIGRSFGSTLSGPRLGGQPGAPGPLLLIDLQDDGPGITPAQADRVFDAFYTTREKGTGLGLALCRKIATAHGGRLELCNPGQPGAHFRLALPLCTEPPV